MSIEIVTNKKKETIETGKALAKEILKITPQKKAFLICLKGDLGGGKTTFIQGFTKGLGIREKILSPTFIIFRKFKIKKSKYEEFYHFDCYRIKKPKEILMLNFKEIISNPKNIVAVEWADRIKKILPKNVLWIEFKFLNLNKRKIIF